MSSYLPLSSSFWLRFSGFNNLIVLRLFISYELTKQALIHLLSMEHWAFTSSYVKVANWKTIPNTMHYMCIKPEWEKNNQIIFKLNILGYRFRVCNSLSNWHSWSISKQIQGMTVFAFPLCYIQSFTQPFDYIVQSNSFDTIRELRKDVLQCLFQEIG